MLVTVPEVAVIFGEFGAWLIEIETAPPAPVEVVVQEIPPPVNVVCNL